MFKQNFWQFITAQPTIAALVASRIYPGYAPSSAQSPYCTYKVDSDQSTLVSGGPSGLHECTLEITAVGGSDIEVQSIKKAFNNILDSKKNSMNNFQVDSFLNHGTDDSADNKDASDTRYFFLVFEYQVFYHE